VTCNDPYSRCDQPYKMCPKTLRPIVAQEIIGIDGALTGHTLANGNKAIIRGIPNSKQNRTPPPCFPSIPMPCPNRYHIKGVPETHNIVLFQLQPSRCSLICEKSLAVQTQGTITHTRFISRRQRFSLGISFLRSIFLHCAAI